MVHFAKLTSKGTSKLVVQLIELFKVGALLLLLLVVVVLLLLLLLLKRENVLFTVKLNVSRHVQIFRFTS